MSGQNSRNLITNAALRKYDFEKCKSQTGSRLRNRDTNNKVAENMS